MLSHSFSFIQSYKTFIRNTVFPLISAYKIEEKNIACSTFLLVKSGKIKNTEKLGEIEDIGLKQTQEVIQSLKFTHWVRKMKKYIQFNIYKNADFYLAYWRQNFYFQRGVALIRDNTIFLISEAHILSLTWPCFIWVIRYHFQVTSANSLLCTTNHVLPLLLQKRMEFFGQWIRTGWQTRGQPWIFFCLYSISM